MSKLELALANGPRLSVRDFVVDEGMNRPFRLALTVRVDAAYSVEALVGAESTFEAYLWGDLVPPARWTGHLTEIADTGGDVEGHRLYQVELVAKLAILAENRNYRVFQQTDEVAIACRILKEWGIAFVLETDRERYKARDMRVQYGESDFAFFSRMLEEAGVSYTQLEIDGVETVLLRDEPQAATPRAPIRYDDSPPDVGRGEFATSAHIARRLRPARYALQDVDPRRPRHALRFGAHTTSAASLEQTLERFHYEPGSFAARGPEDQTPVADDRGPIRVVETFAQSIAQRRLEAKLSDRLMVSFETNAYDVRPGMVIVLGDHDEPALAEPFLVTATRLVGTDTGAWTLRCDGASTRSSYRPALRTPRPHVQGIESATVVGPPGTELHVDELGRVRVQFRWDRGGTSDGDSSCWVPVSHPWAGAGYGAVYLPRVGQEVVVQFSSGNPDLPVITGRTYTSLQQLPYPLPEASAVTVIAKTNTLGGGGGYNEIKADDTAGGELLSVQAERDLQTLVKREERRTIGVDRITQIGRSEVVDVGQHRDVTIGGVQTRTFTSPRPDAPRTVQTDTNGHTTLEVGSSMVEVTPGKIVMTTGAGATITMEGNAIILEAVTIDIKASTVVNMVTSTTVNIKASATCDIKGAPIDLNC